MTQKTLDEQEKDLRDQYAVTAFANLVRAGLMLGFYHEVRSYGPIKRALKKLLVKQRAETNRDATPTAYKTLFDRLYKERPDGAVDPESALALFRAFEEHVMRSNATASPKKTDIAATAALTLLLDSHARFACNAAKDLDALRSQGVMLRAIDKEATLIYDAVMELNSKNRSDADLNAFRALQDLGAELMRAGKLTLPKAPTKPGPDRAPKPPTNG